MDFSHLILDEAVGGGGGEGATTLRQVERTISLAGMPLSTGSVLARKGMGGAWGWGWVKIMYRWLWQALRRNDGAPISRDVAMTGADITDARWKEH